MTASGLKPAGLGEEEFSHLASFIERELGIRIPAAKRAMLESRFSKRVRSLGLPDLSTYYNLFFSAEGEEERKRFLADVITTNKSDFFREPQHFHFLQRWLAKDAHLFHDAPFRVWSAGCATGEEPYTLSIILSDFADAHPGFKFEIFATDVSQSALDEAIRGVYAEPKIDGVPIHVRHRCFRRSKDPAKRVVRVAPEYREKVRFARLNFMQETYPVRSQFDLILFRNVMIYFPGAIQSAVVNRLCRHLRPGGFFFPGHTESLNAFQVPLQAIAPAIYQKNEAGA